MLLLTAPLLYFASKQPHQTNVLISIFCWKYTSRGCGTFPRMDNDYGNFADRTYNCPSLLWRHPHHALWLFEPVPRNWSYQPAEVKFSKTFLKFWKWNHQIRNEFPKSATETMQKGSRISVGEDGAFASRNLSLVYFITTAAFGLQKQCPRIPQVLNDKVETVDDAMVPICCKVASVLFKKQTYQKFR